MPRCPRGVGWGVRVVWVCAAFECRRTASHGIVVGGMAMGGPPLTMARVSHIVGVCGCAAFGAVGCQAVSPNGAPLVFG